VLWERLIWLATTRRAAAMLSIAWWMAAELLSNMQAALM